MYSTALFMYTKHFSGITTPCDTLVSKLVLINSCITMYDTSDKAQGVQGVTQVALLVSFACKSIMPFDQDHRQVVMDHLLVSR